MALQFLGSFVRRVGTCVIAWRESILARNFSFELCDDLVVR